MELDAAAVLDRIWRNIAALRVTYDAVYLIGQYSAPELQQMVLNATGIRASGDDWIVETVDPDDGQAIWLRIDVEPEGHVDIIGWERGQSQ